MVFDSVRVVNLPNLRIICVLNVSSVKVATPPLTRLSQGGVKCLYQLMSDTDSLVAIHQVSVSMVTEVAVVVMLVVLDRQ